MLAGLQAWYGELHILHGVDLTVREGEVVALLGRNGSGRTPRCAPCWAWSIGAPDRSKYGAQLSGPPPHAIARLGVGYCPEERGIFAGLSCEENLMLPRRVAHDGMTLDQIYDLLPNLAERRSAPGTRLSGGEQQMLAIARILRTGARILLLD